MLNDCIKKYTYYITWTIGCNLQWDGKSQESVSQTDYGTCALFFIIGALNDFDEPYCAVILHTAIGVCYVALLNSVCLILILYFILKIAKAHKVGRRSLVLCFAEISLWDLNRNNMCEVI